MEKRRIVIIKLLLCGVVLVLGLGISMRNCIFTPNPYYDLQYSAALRLQACMNAIKELKHERGIAMSPHEYFDTGMLGEDYNFITTSLGELSAKRTTANSDMAALVVKMFHEVGLQKGDRVGIGLSGSFPSLNLAVMIAGEEMGLDMTIISSVGASTYGANNPELSFPEMLHVLKEDGQVFHDSLFVTPGGDFDAGVNLDQGIVNEILGRITEMGIPIYTETDLATNVQHRFKTYGEIDCFIAVGGNITSTGIAESALVLGQGVLKPTTSYGRLDEKSGLVQHYLAKGVPVINLLNIKRIMADYGLPFDPLQLSTIGSSRIYYTVYYPKLPLLIALGITFMIVYSLKKIKD